MPQRTNWKKWYSAGFWLVSLLYWEILVHAGMYGHFQNSFRYALGFSGALGLGLGALICLLPKKAAFPVNLVLILGLTFLYGSQLVYCFIFGTPYSVSQMGLGADAVTSFWRETLGAMASHFPWILGLLGPLVLLLIFGRKAENPHWLLPCAMAGLAIVVAAGTLLLLRHGGTGMYSDYYFFTSTKSTTTQTLERFGIPATFYLETAHADNAAEEEDNTLVVYTEPTEALPEEADEVPPTYNMLDLDFASLNQKTENQKLISLNNYCAATSASKQNEYTGLLKDYNLILICAESFSPAAVDPVYTPTLYKLTQEGFLFRNYYNSFPNTTTDGEYALMQGLFPDGSRVKEDASMLHSATNYLPFALGNIFNEQRNVKSFGYHNNIASYYRRNLSHPNMGYEMKFNHSGMELSGYWPTSDLEMMEQSVDDYIHEKQFNAYYMTFSGHYQYNLANNAIAHDNFHLVKDIPDYDETQKCYLACHIELDRAMEYLLKRLEEEGIADKTAIVMTGDHFPYGLMRKQYFGMLGQEEDDFAMYKSDLIFWVGGMDNPIEVNEYCCNIDVLPTILNLWGFQYDSRLLPGTDVFSDGLHAAVLVDRSFLTDTAWFSTNTGEIRLQKPEQEVPENYIENMNLLIDSKFNFCAEILRNDYYRFVFGK